VELKLELGAPPSFFALPITVSPDLHLDAYLTVAGTNIFQLTR